MQNLFYGIIIGISTIILEINLKKINNSKSGGGGTLPVKFAEYIKQTNFSGNLIIISDGQVSSSMVNECEKEINKNGNYKFNYVTVYLISTGHQVNMSISCPFTRNSPYLVEVYDRGKKVSDLRLTQEEITIFDNLDKITTIKEFENNSKSIGKCIQSKTMGKQVSSVSDSLYLNYVKDLYQIKEQKKVVSM